MKTVFAAATALALLGSATITSAASQQELTPKRVTEFKKAWGDGIVKIGKIHSKGGDYRSAAKEHVKEFYAFDDRVVLFKPTLASEDQFRGSFDEAVSYFVGGSVSEDNGFAIAPYTNVRWENEDTIIDGNTAMSMGNYYFTQQDGSEVKVEYTFGITQEEDNDLKIILHHSSMPHSAG